MSIPLATPTGAEFYIPSEEENRQDAMVFITSADIQEGDQPKAGGIDDPHMGTTLSTLRCGTCKKNKQQCLGHTGALKLNYPVVHPLAVRDVLKWLRSVCHSCGVLLLTDKFIEKNRNTDVLAAYASAARTTERSCPSCGHINEQLSQHKTQKLKIYIGEYKEIDSRRQNRLLYPHMIKEIFSRVRDADVIRAGYNIKSHPRNYVISVIRVPPPTVRPPVRKMTGARVTTSDITGVLSIIAKKNESIGAIPTPIDANYEKKIYALNEYYYSFVRGGTGDNATISNAGSLKSKQGILRLNIMGKRSTHICRSTIIGDGNIPIDSLGVPLSFAMTIDIEETVRPYNKERLLSYIRNGKNIYPGAIAVAKGKTGVRYDIDKVNPDDIEYGDKVYRHVIDGDVAIFNRQPTLMISNMSAHRLIVMRDPHTYPFRMNVCATPLYNADFDGDAMNLVFVQSEAARSELALLCPVRNWAISYSNSKLMIGQVDDGIIGLAELTRDDVRINKYHAMRLFDKVSSLPIFTEETYTGRDIASLILRSTGINYRQTATYYREAYEPYIKYSKSETQVVIRNGQLVSGILDKASIGKGASGGLYHVIASEHGAGRALHIMHDMQKLAVAYLGQRGFTIGMRDILLPPFAYEQINGVTSRILAKADILSEQLTRGEIVPMFGQTIGSMYENQMIETLKHPDDFYRIVINNIDARNNNLFNLISTGSKGNPEQLFNMVISVGQKKINGNRLEESYGVARTSAYALRFSTRPIDHGYIANSLTVGVNSHENLANSAASRNDLVIKALSTSVTGEQNRKSVLCLSSIHTDHYGQSTKNGIVLELVYGDNYADARRVEDTVFNTVAMNDADIQKMYHHADYPDFATTVIADRDKYRHYYGKMEDLTNVGGIPRKIKLMFNLQRIVENVMSSRQSNQKLSGDDGKKAISYLLQMVDGLPYVFMNEIQEKKRAKILPHMQAAAWLPQMIIRSVLHPNALIEGGIDLSALQQIFSSVRLKMTRSSIAPGTAVGIIAAQAFSEPLTQYMLDAHHRSALGGSSFASMDTVKAILGAKEVKDLKNSSMFIRVDPRYEEDEKKVTEIANSIEITSLREFIYSYQIFFESLVRGPVHPDYKHEKAIIDTFMALNPALRPPENLMNYCIRMVVSKNNIVLKDMPLETIVSRLRALYPDFYIVYTPENAPEVILRIYMRSGSVQPATTEGVSAKVSQLLRATIRGIAGIEGAKTIPIRRSVVGADGGLTERKIYAIKTNGTNLIGVIGHPGIDPNRVMTDSVRELADVYGITAARQQIIMVLKDIVECNWCHLALYADEMTMTGDVTPIEPSGIDRRDPTNIYLRMGMSSPLSKIISASLANMKTSIGDMVSSLMVGTVPKIGTRYNEYVVDSEFIAKNMESPGNIIDDIYQ